MLSFLAIAAITSCDDNDEELFIDGPSTQLAFISDAAPSYLLTFDTKDNLAERFVWSSVEFDTPISVSYELQASTNPSDFDNAITVTSSNTTSASLSVERLNDVAAELGLTPFSLGNISVRVVGSTADVTMEPLVSDVLNLAVTPYTTESPKLWVPGNYAEDSGYGPNWSPDNDNTPFLEAVAFGSTVFEGFIFMNVAAPEFKLTPQMNFDSAYGDAGAGIISLGAGGNLTVPAPGYYFITVDTDPDGDPSTDDATIEATQRVWGMIGTATLPSNPAEWGDELDMTYDQDAKVWVLELNMQSGPFKFRSQQWSPDEYNFGQGEEPGALQFNGSDLMNDATGRFRAELDLSTPRQYTYTLTAI